MGGSTGGGGRGGNQSHANFLEFNIMPMGVAWKELSSNGCCPSPNHHAAPAYHLKPTKMSILLQFYKEIGCLDRWDSKCLWKCLSAKVLNVGRYLVCHRHEPYSSTSLKWTVSKNSINSLSWQTVDLRKLCSRPATLRVTEDIRSWNFSDVGRVNYPCPEQGRDPNSQLSSAIFAPILGLGLGLCSGLRVRLGLFRAHIMEWSGLWSAVSGGY